MAGVLSFSLELNGTNYLQSLSKSDGATLQFRDDVKLTDEALKNLHAGMNRLHFPEINVPGVDQFVSNLDKVPGSMARATQATHSFKEGTKVAREGTHALSMAMAQIGYQVAPTVTSNLLTATSVLKALNSAAVAGGVSIGAISLAAVGAGAAFFTWSKGIEAVLAGMKATASAEALMDQMTNKLIPSMLKEVDQLVSRGRLTSEKAAGLKNMLNSGNEDFQKKAAKEVTKIGLQSNEKDIAGFNKNQFRNYTEQINIEAIGEPVKRAQALIDLEFDKLREALIEKASELRQGGPILDQALKSLEITRARKKEEAEQKLTPAPEIKQPLPSPNVSALEKMGFIMGGSDLALKLANRGPMEFAAPTFRPPFDSGQNRSNFDVSREQLSEQKKTNQLLQQIQHTKQTVSLDFTNK